MTHSSFLKTLAALTVGFLALSCTKPMETVLSLSDLAANFEATGSLEKTVSVTSNYDWTVSCPESWVSISPASGTGNGSFKITVAENKTFEARSATVTVKANDKTASVKVSQLALTPSILVSPATAEVEAAGGTVSVDITSNSPWTVSVPADGSWAVPDATSGEGSKKVTFTVAPNENFAARSVDVTFTAQDKKATVKISQKAPAPTLEVNPSAASVGAEGGPVELTVTSNAPWTITSSEEWISAEPSSGQSDGKVILTVAPSEVRAVRSAIVTIKETVNNTEKTVNISQEALPLGHKADSLALVAIYNASKGAEWTKGNWDLTKEMSTWTGVTLTDGRVTALKLTTTVAIPENWTLPEEVVDLTALTDLRINKQKLSGEFPAVLCRMSWLKVLYLQGNNFTGSLPAGLGQMTDLTDLYVDQNTSMSGSIPHEIGNLKKLMRLNVSQSGIGGEIPVELGQCQELLQFMAFKCNLSGTLPDIWDLPKLQSVMLHTNPGLTGPLPASLGKLKKISTAGPSIQIYNCNITGNIPESFAELDGGEKKVQVHIYGNKMSGVVPASVQAHKDFSSWKINPQQEGYGLALHAGSGGQDLDQPVHDDPWN